MESTAWSKDLAVEVAGHGVVSHAGSAAVRLLADRTGLTGGHEVVPALVELGWRSPT